MPFNIHLARKVRVSLAVWLLTVPALSAQARCPTPTAAAVERGWRAYRADSLAAAAERFGRADRLCPVGLDAKVGLGFTLLRQDRLFLADLLFDVVLRRDSSNADAWEGRARVAYRRGDTTVAIASARRVTKLNPGHRDIRELLHRLSPDWDRPPLRKPPRPGTLQLASRTRGDRFEIRSRSGWIPFHLQGVNLGVALPGRLPSEFPPDSATYAGWLRTIADMHANTVRLYTILPPAFYRALRGWNVRHPNAPLWLVHGVWTELPPGDDFDQPQWKEEFRTEMRQVVDLIHGAIEIPLRPGHAGGRYDADVSTWTLSYIIGREWEPFAVRAYDAGHPGLEAYRGRYLEVERAPAMDRWMAEQCDYLLAYEADSYNALRPIAYTNWPTLDPLTHPTESSTAEEAAWRIRSGRPSEGQKLEYENDAIGLDATLVRPTSANPAGWFASYHAYPYYPDFMIYDPGYAAARSSEGTSSYFGYLRELMAHHSGIPTVISEYGVPSSRGIAHLQPQGWHHGGHDELAMAAIDARLTREIREAGGAGSIVFAWLDEWFKKNWIVIDFEIPLEHTRLWHNVMDAEQNYGILGQYAGAPGAAPVLGGDPGRWLTLPLVQRSDRAVPGAPSALRIGSDESYIYIAVELGPGRFPWDSIGVQLAIDTHLPKVGQHRLPLGVTSELGFEFLVDLVAPDSATLRVTPEYNRHAAGGEASTGDHVGRFYRRPVTILDRGDGRFDSLWVITNRARFGRDGSFFPARRVNRGRLAYGTEKGSTLADWYLDEAAGLLQLRLPWDLLNVTDPSTRTLLFECDSVGDFGTAVAEEFHAGVLVYQKTTLKTIGTLPALRDGVWPAEGFAGWRWDGWTEPTSHGRLKPVYDSLRTLWGSWRSVPTSGSTPARSSRPAP